MTRIECSVGGGGRVTGGRWSEVIGFGWGRAGAGPALCAVLVAGLALPLAACLAPTGSVDPSRCQGTCVDRPHCSLELGSNDFPENPLHHQLGCGPVYLYKNGAEAGDMGGNGSFCPDSPANRQLLHENGRTGFRPGYCESCLGVPPGQLFVLWMVLKGPSCPSGCVPGVGPPPF